MIKVSVMYPTGPGTKFDHEYYKDRHMPLVKELLGSSCQYYTIDKGLAGGESGVLPPYVAACDIFSESIELFQEGMASGGARILADISSFTDIKPIIQISEVIVGYPAN